MRALWGFILGVVVWCVIWSASVARPNGRPTRRRKGQHSGGARGTTSNATIGSIEGWDWWSTFEQDVSEEELQGLYSGFLERKLAALWRVFRGGQLQFGVTRPETIAEHTLDLEKLGGQYSAERGFTLWRKLILSMMFRGHDIHERRMEKDTPKFPDIPEDPEERRRFVLDWQPPTREEEWERWVDEWRRERELFRGEIASLSERKQRILLYLFDWFCLGQDELAQLARELHYLQPALSIWRRTESWYARLMHYRRALAILSDRVVIRHLLRSCRMVE